MFCYFATVLGMSDDSETVEDTKKGSLAEVTDDSCTAKFIEIVPLNVHSITKQHCVHVNTGIDLSVCLYTTDVSQGSEATCFRCGGKFSGRSIANLLLSIPVQKTGPN